MRRILLALSALTGQRFRRRALPVSLFLLSSWTATVAVLAVLFSVMFFRPVSASAAIPTVISLHMTEVEEWVYRNGALEVDPMSCHELCSNLWTAEHRLRHPKFVALRIG